MRSHFLDSPISYHAILLFVRYVPTKICYWLGKLVALVVYAFSKKARRGFEFNLSLALGESADRHLIRKTTRKIFVNYAYYMVDYFLLPQLPPRRIKRKFAFLEGEEILKDALAKGRGAILLSAHLGNWEIGGSMLRALNYPLAVAALPHNTAAANALVGRLRLEKGIQVIEVDQSPFSGIGILRHLRNNEIVAMIGDKDLMGRGRPITYFGQKVTFPVGPVLLAMKSGAALIPTFVLRQLDGRYFGVLEEAVPLLLEGDRDEIIEKNLGKTARVFEKYVRSHADQWYCPDPITGSMAP